MEVPHELRKNKELSENEHEEGEILREEGEISDDDDNVDDVYADDGNGGFSDKSVKQSVEQCDSSSDGVVEDSSSSDDGDDLFDLRPTITIARVREGRWKQQDTQFNHKDPSGSNLGSNAEDDAGNESLLSHVTKLQEQSNAHLESTSNVESLFSEDTSPAKAPKQLGDDRRNRPSGSWNTDVRQSRPAKTWKRYDATAVSNYRSFKHSAAFRDEVSRRSSKARYESRRGKMSNVPVRSKTTKRSFLMSAARKSAATFGARAKTSRPLITDTCRRSLQGRSAQRTPQRTDALGTRHALFAANEPKSSPGSHHKTNALRKSSYKTEAPRRSPHEIREPRRSPHSIDAPRRSPHKTDAPRRSPHKTDAPRRSAHKNDAPRRSPHKIDAPRRSHRKTDKLDTRGSEESDDGVTEAATPVSLSSSGVTLSMDHFSNHQRPSQMTKETDVGKRSPLAKEKSVSEVKISCPVCKSQAMKEMGSCHLPWYFHPSHCCWSCEMSVMDHRNHTKCDENGGKITSSKMLKWVHLMNGFLWFLTETVGLSDLNSLLNQVQELWDLLNESKSVQLTTCDINLMHFYEMVNGINSPTGKEYNLNPPNCVAALLHWNVMTTVIQNLTSQELEDLKKLVQPRDFSGAIVSEDPKLNIAGVDLSHPVGADAHLLLDSLGTLSFVSNYNKIVTRRRDPCSIQIDMMVASFASYPNLWPNEFIRNQIIKDRKVRLVIGWDPSWTGAVIETQLDEFAEELQKEGVVAGEMGLDYSCSRQIQQRALLRSLLHLVLKSRKPVVIRCREAAKDGTSAEVSAQDDCIRIMQQVLPPAYYVYISNFNGGIQESQKWIKSFPNAVFGISPIILDSRKQHPGLDKVIEIINEKRLLLQTNAPSSVPDKYIENGLIAHSDLLEDIAEKVANIRMTHRALVLDATAKNTRRFFRC